MYVINWSFEFVLISVIIKIYNIYITYNMFRFVNYREATSTFLE